MVSTHGRSYANNPTPVAAANEETTDDNSELCGQFHRMTVGAKEKSYHAVSGGFAVYDNEIGAVKQTGVIVKPRGVSVYNVNSLKQALLVAGEKQLKVLNKDGKVHALKIETEQVVRTWDTARNEVNLPQEALAYAYKGSGCEGNGGDLLVGMTSSTVALWDYMTKQGEAARTDNFRAYSKSPGFACIATGGDTGKPVGTVVAGCSDGAIKVFENGNLARAASDFKGLGRPITGIDITYSSSAEDQWVVATTDKYLLVVQRKFLTGSGGSSKTGDAPMGRILLKLKPADVDKTVGAPLMHGRLSYVTESGILEDCIAASCGAYLIIWNFRRVKAAALSKEYTNKEFPDYRITGPVEQRVLDSHFMHTSYKKGQQEVVLAATDNAMYARPTGDI